jgi:hypothetical protein
MCWNCSKLFEPKNKELPPLPRKPTPSPPPLPAKPTIVEEPKSTALSFVDQNKDDNYGLDVKNNW